MRMEITACLCMNQTKYVLISDILYRCFGFVYIGVAIGIEEPVVVCIFVMITSNLLLLRPFGVGLHVRVKEPTTISHIFEGSSRTVGNFKRAIFSNLRSSEVCLEQRTHLCIPRAAVFQNQEVYVKRKHVNH